jgi:hypothetical protein
VSSDVPTPWGALPYAFAKGHNYPAADLTDLQFRLVIALWAYQGGAEDGWPSMETLTVDVGRSLDKYGRANQAVRRALTELADAGYVERSRKSRRDSYRYNITPLVHGEFESVFADPRTIAHDGTGGPITGDGPDALGTITQGGTGQFEPSPAMVWEPSPMMGEEEPREGEPSIGDLRESNDDRTDGNEADLDVLPPLAGTADVALDDGVTLDTDSLVNDLEISKNEGTEWNPQAAPPRPLTTPHAATSPAAAPRPTPSPTPAEAISTACASDTYGSLAVGSSSSGTTAPAASNTSSPSLSAPETATDTKRPTDHRVCGRCGVPVARAYATRLVPLAAGGLACLECYRGERLSPDCCGRCGRDYERQDSHPYCEWCR